MRSNTPALSSSVINAVTNAIKCRVASRRLAAAPADSKKVDAETAQNAMDAFAKAVGQPAGMDPEILDVLWDQCLDALGAAPDSSQAPAGPQAPPPDEATARTMLSASELRAVDGTKGATATDFLALKAARARSEIDFRKPLNANGSRG